MCTQGASIAFLCSPLKCVICLWKAEIPFEHNLLPCITSCFDVLRNWGRHKFCCCFFFVASVANKNYFCERYHCWCCVLDVKHVYYIPHLHFLNISLRLLFFPSTSQPLVIWCDRENCLINVLGNNLWPSSDRYCFLPNVECYTFESIVVYEQVCRLVLLINK